MRSLDLVTDTDAPLAQHASVVVHGESVMGRVDGVPRIDVIVMDVSHPQVHCQLLEFAVPVGDANRTDMVPFREDQFKDLSAIILHSRGVRDYLHVLPAQSDTRRHQLWRPFHFDDAQSASSALG